MSYQQPTSPANPVPPSQRAMVLGSGQEAVQAGWPMTFVGVVPPQLPRIGQVYYDTARNCIMVYAGWQELRDDEDLYVPNRNWRCAYCRTVFDEKRCPTCGAGREG